MKVADELPILFFENAHAWEAWLETHFAQTKGIWIKFAKKNARAPSITYDEALDAALCYGWIDGQVKTFDAEYYLQRFTPRRPKSVWSKRNTDKVTQLIAADKMKPAGLAEVEAAKRDGRWAQAYDSPGNMTMPADFKAALAEHPKAQAFYETLNKTNTYAILWRLQTAKRPETRQTRMTQYIQMLEEGKKFHP